MYLIMLTSQHTDTALALSEPNLDTSPSTRTLGDQTKYSGSRVKEVQTLAHCTLHNCTGQHHARVRHACQHVSHVSWCGEGVSPVSVSPAIAGGGDWLLDCCHGSGPAGAAAARAGRRWRRRRGGSIVRSPRGTTPPPPPARPAMVGRHAPAFYGHTVASMRSNVVFLTSIYILSKVHRLGTHENY